MQTTSTSVRKSVVVEAPQERAFDVFTRGYDSWWPRSHHTGEAELEEAVIEQREGGRWYGRGVDGVECETGKVVVWDPPRRLVLTWQLTADWRFDPDFVTEVEVTFTPEGDGRTRVELEHRNLDRYGDDEGKIRETIDSPGGWSGLLETFAAAVAA